VLAQQLQNVQLRSWKQQQQQQQRVLVLCDKKMAQVGWLAVEQRCCGCVGCVFVLM
jgi:hypothetical protein